MTQGNIPPSWTGRGLPPVPGAPTIPDLGRDSPPGYTHVLDLSVERSNVMLPLTGSALWVVKASSTVATATISINRPNEGSIPIGQGFGFRGLPYSRLYIDNPAQAGESLTLFAVREMGGFGFLNPAVSVTTFNPAKPTSVTNIGPITVPTGYSSTLILSANANRRHAILQIQDGHTPDAVHTMYRIGPDSNWADLIIQGAMLERQDVLHIDGTMAYYAMQAFTDPAPPLVGYEWSD